MYAPGFQSPPSTDYVGYCAYVQEKLPPETPYLYGLHPNAEIGFLAQTSEHMFMTVLEMQPRDTAGGGGAGVTREEKVSNGQVEEGQGERVSNGEVEERQGERVSNVRWWRGRERGI